MDSPLEASYLSNGRFLHNLGNWTASNVSYAASDGDAQYGMAVLSTGGGALSQQFTVNGAKRYSLHLSVKPTGANLSAGQATLAIVDGDGNAVLTQNLSGTSNTWSEQTYEFGLAQGTTYTLTITNVSASSTVKVDDVWLWFVPLSRTVIASTVADKLGLLGSDRGLSLTPSGSNTEGDYTGAIDNALRALDSIDPLTGEPDIRWLTPSRINAVLKAVENEMLQRLQRDYATMVDITVGQRSEKLSQIVAAIGKLVDSNGADDGSSGVVYTHRGAAYFDELGGSLMGWL